MLTSASVWPGIIIAFFTLGLCRLSRSVGGGGGEGEEDEKKEGKTGREESAFKNYTFLRKKVESKYKGNAYLC